MSVKWFEIPGYFNYVEQYEMIAHYLPEGSKFVELGCLLGKSTNFMASRLKELNKKFEFHVVDTFEGTAGEHDHMDEFYDDFFDHNVPSETGDSDPQGAVPKFMDKGTDIFSPGSLI